MPNIGIEVKGAYAYGAKTRNEKDSVGSSLETYDRKSEDKKSYSGRPG